MLTDCAVISSLVPQLLSPLLPKGMYLGFFFGLNHYAEARMEGNNTSWPRWQTTTAVNWEAHRGTGFLSHANAWFWAVMSGFLNLQVEHHFFPQMPPFAYVLAQPEIEEFCKKHKMPYRNLSFFEACTKMFGGLRDTGIEALAARKKAKAEKRADAVAEKKVQ